MPIDLRSGAEPIDSFFSGMSNTQDMLSKILSGRQNQQKIINDKLANEQLNKYRQGELGIQQQTENRLGALNPLNMKLLEAKINAENSLSNQRKNSSTGLTGGVDIKDLVALQKTIMDERGISFKEAGQLAGRALNGEDVGLGGQSAYILDNMNRRRTTASLLNQNINARQADAELNKLNEFSEKASDIAGTTFLGQSPEILMRTIKNDDKSQKELGMFIAGQAIQNEMANIRNRLAMGQPGITAIHDLMKMSGQYIDQKYPRLTASARKYASDYINQALRQGLDARNKVGLRSSTAFNNQDYSSNNNSNRNGQDTDSTSSGKQPSTTPEGLVILYKGGKEYHLPPNKMQEALMEGFTLEN
jgi:hypothetical protein